jgi:hypothetical protein
VPSVKDSPIRVLRILRTVVPLIAQEHGGFEIFPSPDGVASDELDVCGLDRVSILSAAERHALR